jgi:hypothetical protein
MIDSESRNAAVFNHALLLAWEKDGASKKIECATARFALPTESQGPRCIVNRLDISGPSIPFTRLVDAGLPGGKPRMCVVRKALLRQLRSCRAMVTSGRLHFVYGFSHNRSSNRRVLGHAQRRCEDLQCPWLARLPFQDVDGTGASVEIFFAC